MSTHFISSSLRNLGVEDQNNANDDIRHPHNPTRNRAHNKNYNLIKNLLEKILSGRFNPLLDLKSDSLEFDNFQDKELNLPYILPKIYKRPTAF